MHSPRGSAPDRGLGPRDAGLGQAAEAKAAGRPHLRRGDRETVGLAVIGGEFRQEFVVAEPFACRVLARMSSVITAFEI